MLSLPGTLHGENAPPENITNYFVRLSLPRDLDITHGAVPGCLIAEMDDAGLPVPMDISDAGTNDLVDLVDFLTFAGLFGTAPTNTAPQCP